MTDEELEQLIKEIGETQYEADCYSDDMPTRAAAYPPASSDDISRLENHLKSRGLALPPSFAQLLRVHNGIENFMPSMELSIRSAQEIVDSSDRDTVWKEISPAYKFVFASGNTAAFVGFLPDTVDPHGEMQVVMVNESSETVEYDNLEDFLIDQLEFYKDVLDAERADRDGLKDD